MNCDICFNTCTNITKKCCVSICFTCDYKLIGLCPICERTSLNAPVECEVCDKIVTTATSYLCIMNTIDNNHFVIHCSDCGIIDDQYCINFCTDLCNHKFLYKMNILRELDDFNIIRNISPNFNINQCLNHNKINI